MQASSQSYTGFKLDEILNWAVANMVNYITGVADHQCLLTHGHSTIYITEPHSKQLR